MTPNPSSPSSPERLPESGGGAFRREQEPFRREGEPAPEREPLPPTEPGPKPSPETEQPRTGQAPARPQPIQRDPVTTALEEILSEDLGPMFAEMTPQQKATFKAEGEKTASLIRQMVETAKAKTKSVIDLVKRWLRLIPGVNKFFVEQEAKIKADKVIALQRKIHGVE